MIRFYRSPCIQITSVAETTTVEQTITLTTGGSVRLEYTVPTVAKSICIYKSTTTNNETLLAEIPMDDYSRNRSEASMTFNYVDDGSVLPGITPYPVSTILTADELKAVPVPEFTLTEVAGGSLAGQHFYRVSYKTVPDYAPAFQPKLAHVRLYHTDLTEVLLFSNEDLATEPYYTLEIDPFTYVEPLLTTAFFNMSTQGAGVYNVQEIRVPAGILNKYVALPIPVTMFTGRATVILGEYVNIMMSPNDVEVEVYDGPPQITTPQIVKGTFSKKFSEEGTVTYFASDRCRMLFTLGGVSFRVIA